MSTGSSLLYGPSARRSRPLGLPEKIGRLIRDAGVDAAFAAFAREAALRVGKSDPMDPEIEVAARLIAARQVSATYEGDPTYTGNRYDENRAPEEAEMVTRQTTYLVLAGISGSEPPSDPRIHLYRWAERAEVLRVSPITRTLLPLGVFGRNVAAWFKDLPAEHRQLMHTLYIGEGSNLVADIHAQLTDLLIDGDGSGFCGLQERLNLAKRALGYGGLPVPLLDFERNALGGAMVEAFHPLPGSWLELRKQIALAGGVKMKIRRHLDSRSAHLRLATDATEQDWEEVAVACIAYSDEQAKEDLEAIGRRISRRRTRAGDDR